MWSWRPAADADVQVRRLKLSKENDSTGHETMTLRKRKVTAWVAGQSQLLTAICAADNLE
jgi:hypothetical protein